MDWIKRNLYFVIGSVVALVLMGLAGYYLYSKWALNNERMAKLDADYAELDRLNKESPHPGSGDVDNIAAAKKQQQELGTFIKEARRFFQRIPAIPDEPKVTSQDFTAALRTTISRLQKEATNASVILRPDYAFSFEAQKPRVTFAAGSLEPLSVQLGEVKSICDVLFQAKINSLDNIRRSRVSSDDSSGPQTDYLDAKPVTNELAVLTPYEVTFRCFSPELAAALSGFASSPHAFLIKTINIEAASTNAPGADLSMEQPYAGGAIPGMGDNAATAALLYRRYGMAGPGGRGGRPMGNPYAQPPPTAPPGYTPPPGGFARPGGLPTVLDERQLQVTARIEIVKLLPTPPAK